MVPSPMLIDVDQENKLEVGLKVPLNQDDKNLRCTNNCEDTNFDMEALLDQQTVVPAAAESSEVEIIECTNASEIRLPEGDDPDATEYSSSFGDTVSGNDDGSRLSDAEVESHFCGDNGLGANVFDGFSSLFQMRKKKLTAHWRRYIRPLMWRCKWVELRIKEFRAQALKYDRELAAYEQRKQLELGQYASEGCGRTLPFCRQIYRKKPMKRRKRKKSEDMVDIPSYMSLHNLFSYYENKKPDADAASVDEDCGNQADVNSNDELDVNCEWPSLECRDGDNSIEQILWKIEIAQSKAQKLKTQVDKLLSTNAGKFSSMENLSLLVSSDLPTSSARSPTFSPRHGDAMPIGALYTPPRHISEYEIGDLVMPESAVSSYGEVTPLPDIIESTVGLLSAAEASLDHPQDGDSCKDLVDNVIINNHAAEKELHSFEKVSTLPTKVKEEQEEKNIVTPLVAAAPEPEQPAQETIVPKEESVMKLTLCSEIHVPKNKRKRGERKPGSGAWNAEKISTQRSSGEPDN